MASPQFLLIEPWGTVPRACNGFHNRVTHLLSLIMGFGVGFAVIFIQLGGQTSLKSGSEFVAARSMQTNLAPRTRWNALQPNLPPRTWQTMQPMHPMSACQRLQLAESWKSISTPPHPARLALCASGRQKAHQFLKPDAEKRNIVANKSQFPCDKGITVITGPSRQGKSEMANKLVGYPAFSVSDDPLNGHTFGAWAATCQHGIIIDTEGRSHQVSESTRKLFCVTYPICKTLIFSSKELGADSFLRMMEEMAGVMDDYRKGNALSKPVLVLLLRDAEMFGFQMNGAKYVHGKTGKTVNEFVQERIVPKVQKYGLFSKIYGLGIPCIKGLEGKIDSVGDMPRLLQIMNSAHPGPLINVWSNPDELQNLVANVNENAGFDLKRFELDAMRCLSQFQFSNELQKKQAAEVVDWSATRLLSEFEQCKVPIIKHLEKFENPNMRQELLRIEMDVRLLADRIAHKERVYETEKKQQIVYHPESRTVPDGTKLAQGARWGGFAGLLLGLAAGGPVGAVVASSTIGGTLGAVTGNQDTKTRQVTISTPKVITTTENKFVGYKLGISNRSSKR